MKNKITLTEYLIISFLLICFFINSTNFFNHTKNLAPTYDDINIVKSTKYDFFDIWTGKDSIDIISFIKLSKNKLSEKEFINTDIDKLNDGFELRNHHGVLLTYLSKKFFKNNEISYNSILNNFFNYRVFNFFFLIFLIFFACYIFFKENFLYFTLIPVTILSSPALLEITNTINHHFLLGIILYLIILLFYFIENNKIKFQKSFLYFSSLIALSLLTLETGVFFIFFIIIVYYKIYNLNYFKSDSLKILLFITFVILLIYPGFYINFDLVKSISYVIYRLFITTDNSLNHSINFLILKNFLFKNFLLSLIFFILFFYSIIKKKISIHIIILFIVPLVYGFIVLFNLFDQRYLFPTFISLVAVSIIILKKIIYLRYVKIYIFALCFLSLVNNHFYIKKIHKNFNNYNILQSGFLYPQFVSSDLNKINFIVISNINKFKIYSDFHNLINISTNKTIHEALIDNGTVLLSKNYNRYQLSDRKKEKKLILIFQKRLINQNNIDFIKSNNFKQINLDVKNFIVFKEK